MAPAICDDPRFADLGEPIKRLLIQLAEGGDGVDEETVAMLTHVGVRQLAKVYEMLETGADPQTILAWLKQRARAAREREEELQRQRDQKRTDPRLVGVVPCVVKLSWEIGRPASDEECDLAQQWMSETYVSVPEMATIADSIELAGDPVKAWDEVMEGLRRKRQVYQTAERAAAEDALGLARKADGFGGVQKIGVHQATDEALRAAIKEWFDGQSDLGKKGYRIDTIPALYRNNGWEVSAEFTFRTRGGAGGEDFRRFVYDPVTCKVVAMDGRGSGSKQATTGWHYGPVASIVHFRCEPRKADTARKTFNALREEVEGRNGLRSLLFWLSPDGAGGAQLVFDNQAALDADAGSEGVVACVFATLRARSLLLDEEVKSDISARVC
eukprot:Hpha_TRINITY_DN15124_c0_g3::TRINITY_DN15124_c0_g3_i1::g.129494::m.129494